MWWQTSKPSQRRYDRAYYMFGRMWCHTYPRRRAKNMRMETSKCFSGNDWCWCGLCGRFSAKLSGARTPVFAVIARQAGLLQVSGEASMYPFGSSFWYFIHCLSSLLLPFTRSRAWNVTHSPFVIPWLARQVKIAFVYLLPETSYYCWELAISTQLRSSSLAYRRV